MKRMFQFIPSLMTVCNLALGFVSLLLAYDGFIATAAMMVLIGMVLDAFDGRIARWAGCESAFGRELDSLSDIVTFGIAPSFLMYISTLNGAGWFALFSAMMFPVCGALRLARFNVQVVSSKYFVGLPITAAGGILATLALYRNELSEVTIIMPVCMICLSLLMVSKVKYPNFKRIGFPRSAAIGVPTLALLIYVAFRFNRGVANRLVFIPLAFYAVYGAVRMTRRRLHVRRQDSAQPDVESEPYSPR